MGLADFVTVFDQSVWNAFHLSITALVFYWLLFSMDDKPMTLSKFLNDCLALAGRCNVNTIHQYHYQHQATVVLPDTGKSGKISKGNLDRHLSIIVLFFGYGYFFLKDRKGIIYII